MRYNRFEMYLLHQMIKIIMHRQNSNLLMHVTVIEVGRSCM